MANTVMPFTHEGSIQKCCVYLLLLFILIEYPPRLFSLRSRYHVFVVLDIPIFERIRSNTFLL